MFRPIDCVQTNVQPGFRRFSSPYQPLIKSWRCELTGLSHSYNLYFVACNDKIHIYTPIFPTQNLSAEPDLILHPPISSPTLEMGIDETDPHSITRLHIDYLGREEILLVTCDDGDVIGYRVPEIYRVITEAQQSPDEQDGVDLAQQVRVFLHRNVGGSAWGLAVHREARLIAISANTHQVTVLAYALSKTTSDSDSETHEDLEGFASDEEEGDFPYPRRRDHVITLQAATNIPAVSFDQGDVEGRWLLSSCVDGDNHLWDLYNPYEPARLIELGYCVSAQDPTQPPGPCRCQNRTSVPHAAWGAMFIDPRSCHRTTSLAEACGPGSRYTELLPGFWDITETEIRYSTRRSGPMPGSFGLQDPMSSGSDDMSLSGSGSSVASASIDGEEGDAGGGDEGSDDMSTDDGEASETEQPLLSDNTPLHEAPAPAPAPAPVPSHIELPTQPLTQTLPQIQIPPLTQALPHTHIPPPIDPPPPPSNHPAATGVEQDLLNLNPGAPQHTDLSAIWPDINDPIDISDDDDSDDSSSALQLQLQLAAGVLPTNWLLFAGSQSVPNPYQIARNRPPLPKHPYCTTSTSQSFEDIPSRPAKPCVIVTKDEVYLFQRPFDPKGDGRDPILAMRDPLFPPLQSPREAKQYQRNCYSTQIPELGIFLVANPAGRVGIFSLTQYTEGKQRPLYAFRMDHLLPSSRHDGELVIEEVWGRRLIGVAVGPVQGMLDREQDADGDVDMGGSYSGGRGGTTHGGSSGGMGGRRWRLMLHYHDHTVYSYELGKYGGSEAHGLGDLVV